MVSILPNGTSQKHAAPSFGSPDLSGGLPPALACLWDKWSTRTLYFWEFWHSFSYLFVLSCCALLFILQFIDTHKNAAQGRRRWSRKYSEGFSRQKPVPGNCILVRVHRAQKSRTCTFVSSDAFSSRSFWHAMTASPCTRENERVENEGATFSRCLLQCAADHWSSPILDWKRLFTEYFHLNQCNTLRTFHVGCVLFVSPKWRKCAERLFSPFCYPSEANMSVFSPRMHLVCGLFVANASSTEFYN